MGTELRDELGGIRGRENTNMYVKFSENKYNFEKENERK